MEKPIVSFDRVDFLFEENSIHRDLSLRIPGNSITVILGPSGCGKSTLLNLVGGRLRPHSGSVRVFDQEVSNLNRAQLYALRRRMGMMFQSSALLTDLTVFENVAFPIRENTDLPESLTRSIVLMKLEQVGLRGTQDMMPSELSGGMARRVALARAIALDPELILYDEPFTGLDPVAMGVIIKLVKELNDVLGTTSIVVTHDVEQGLSIADHVYLLGKGGILASGSAQQLLDCAEEDVKQFLHGLPDGPVPFHYPSDDFHTELLN